MQELIKALSKAQGEFAPVLKDKKNPHFKNNYASLDAIIEATRPALAANGLAFTQVLDDEFLVTTLWHSSGDSIISRYHLSPMADPQKFGSQLTYARRYSLSAILGVAADEDDDGNASAQAVVQPQQPRANLAPLKAAREASGWTVEQLVSLSKEYFEVEPSSLNDAQIKTLIDTMSKQPRGNQ